MKKRLKWIIPAILFAALVGLLIYIFLKPSAVTPSATGELAMPKPSPSALPNNLQKPQQPGATPDLSIYKTDPRWIWWNEQMERDPKFEWKMPINFYGKIIDQSNQPVGGVEIVFQWTDLSNNGTTEQTVLSSADGRFSLIAVTGKNLGIIRMFKEGYYRVRQGTQANFEYAAFFEPHYHQPDASKPVVFRLRKAGEISKELIALSSRRGLAVFC